MINFIQVNCKEGKKVDWRQANAVLKHKPDYIFLEYPSRSLQPIKRVKQFNKKVILCSPWVASDLYMWNNIEKLRKGGKEVKVFAVDGPYSLVKNANRYPANLKYPNKTKNLFWWVRIYLRERFMADNINKILKRYRIDGDKKILVFLQKFHWRHVNFIFQHRSKEQLIDYYFSRFNQINFGDLSKIIKSENKILYKYWRFWLNR